MRAAIYHAPPPEAPLARDGFHATMKAPFRLAEVRRLAEILVAFCQAHAPAPVDRLALRRIGRFFALVPNGSHSELADLAAATVHAFEPFRALTEAEVACRTLERLTPRQRELLAQWDYPHVLNKFRFHMALTCPVANQTAGDIETMLSQRFPPVIDRPLAVDGLAHLVEPEPAAPFRLHSRHSLLSIR